MPSELFNRFGRFLEYFKIANVLDFGKQLSEFLCGAVWVVEFCMFSHVLQIIDAVYLTKAYNRKIMIMCFAYYLCWENNVLRFYSQN